MNVVFIMCIAFFFSGYIFFDAMAVIARASASLMSRNAFGAAIEKMMNTLKRLMIFFYPPILGYFIIKDDLNSIMISIAISYVLAAVVLILLIIKRHSFLLYFCLVTKKFTNGETILKSFIYKKNEIYFAEAESFFSSVDHSFKLAKISDVTKYPRLTLTASWIYFIFGASIFSLNILALAFAQYAPIILQCLGLINGLGTLVLAFVVDPVVSRYLDASKQLDEVALSLLVAQLVACFAIAPAFFIILLKFI